MPSTGAVRWPRDARRTLGAGPQAALAPIRAAQADLLGSLPAVRLPTLMACVTEESSGAAPRRRRARAEALGVGGRNDEV